MVIMYIVYVFNMLYAEKFNEALLPNSVGSLGELSFDC